MKCYGKRLAAVNEGELQGGFVNRSAASRREASTLADIKSLNEFQRCDGLRTACHSPSGCGDTL